MTLWVMSMIVFRGSAIALLRQAAPLADLPKANIVLTMVFGLIGALEPLMAVWLQGIGGSITFILGAIALIVGATILYSATPQHNLFPRSESAQSFASPRLIALIFSIGLGVGIEMNLLLRVFPQTVSSQLINLSNGGITSAIFLISALVALPMGTLTLKLGVQRSMLLGLGAIAGILAFVTVLPSSGFGLIVIGGMAFGLIFDSQIPLALGMLPSDRAGLATGLYFGGIGAATAMIGIILRDSRALAAIMTLILGAIAFVLVAICLKLRTKVH
jgi:hypothetical protein